MQRRDLQVNLEAIARHLEGVLLNMQIEWGENWPKMRDANGAWLATPVLAGLATCYSALTTLETTYDTIPDYR